MDQEMSELEMKQDMWSLGIPEASQQDSVEKYKLCIELISRNKEGKHINNEGLTISQIIRMKREEGSMIYFKVKQ